MNLHDRKSSTSKGTLIAGFIAIVLLLLGVTFLSNMSLDNTVTNLSKVTIVTERQENLLKNMHGAARDRIITLYQMSITDDPFLLDALWLRFNANGTKYITSRNQLYALDLEPSLRSLLQEQDKILMPLGRVQLEIAEHLIEGNQDRARELLISKAAPLQKQVLDYFQRLGKIVEQQDEKALEESFKHAHEARTNIIGFSILGLLLTLVVAAFVFRRVHDYEKKITSEKELAEVTLHSIVDGVIIVNSHGVITEANEAAETMLNEPKQQLLNKHFSSVIRLDKAGEDNTRTFDFDAVLHGDTVISEEGIELIRNNNERLFIEYSFSPIVISEKVTSAVLVMHDITKIHNLTQRLDHEATHDPLTGLLNRRKFEELLSITLNDVRRYKETQTWLCYIDLDNFKNVNDTCGHLVGDEYLSQIARHIENSVRDTDFTARMGGDEFAVILRYSGKEEALAASERIRENISKMQFVYKDQKFDVTASLGLVSLDESVSNINSALSYADSACYRSKNSGRNQVHVYTDV